VSVRSFQKSIAACRVWYSAAFNLTYMTNFLFSLCRYLVYNYRSNLSRISASLPSSLTCTSSTMSACVKAPGMSVVVTSVCSCASIVADINNDSIDTVGEVVSFCFQPSGQPLPFIWPECLSFRNMRYLRASTCSLTVSLWWYFG